MLPFEEDKTIYKSRKSANSDSPNGDTNNSRGKYCNSLIAGKHTM